MKAAFGRCLRPALSPYGSLCDFDRYRGNLARRHRLLRKFVGAAVSRSLPIGNELIDKAWASTRWSKGRRPEDHVCHRAASLLAELYGQLESGQTDLDLLRRAIEENDPKAELLIRVTDLWKRNEAALAQARGEHD